MVLQTIFGLTISPFCRHNEYSLDYNTSKRIYSRRGLRANQVRHTSRRTTLHDHQLKHIFTFKAWVASLTVQAIRKSRPHYIRIIQHIKKQQE